jgi:murein DD-endopeptidase MepM/ murein hydrolase activator NlpD
MKVDTRFKSDFQDLKLLTNNIPDKSQEQMIIEIFKRILARGDKSTNLVPSRIFDPPLDKVFHIPEPKSSQEIYDLPIRAIYGVKVTQGPINQNGNRTHGWYNCLYATDFASSPESPPGEILAAGDGKVVNLNLQGNSSEAASAPGENEGNGFGKWIAIENKNSEISFYAHLSKVIVEVGDLVKKGQKIGVEGVSGQAGHRHLHFSIQRCTENPKKKEFPLHPLYYYTIPYNLRCTDVKSKKQKVFDIREFQNIDSNSKNPIYLT